MANPPTQDRAVSRVRFLEPAAAYQARRHALELIAKGNLLAAWGAVQHLDNDEVEHQWTQVVKWLADFAASLPIPDECDIDLLKHPRMAVRAALRVELALVAGDIPRAAHGTVAFFECAFWDWLKEHDFAAEGITQISESEYQLPSQPSDSQKKRFRKHDSTWRVDDFEKGVKAWLPVLNRPSLEAFWNALTDDIRNLRHDVAHNEPTPQLMHDARRRMAGAQLWSTSGAFLTQPMVQNVLRDLGENDPARLCTDLTDTIRARLLGLYEQP